MTTESEVPVDDPVEVDVSEQQEEEVKQESQASASEAKPEQEQEQEVDDGSEILRQQLLQAQAVIEQSKRQQVEIDRRRQQAETQLRSEQEGRERAQYDAILNAIGAAQAESETGERDLESAMEAQDAKALAAAQRRIARAETQLQQLEDAKAGWEMRQEQLQQQREYYMRQQQMQPQRQPTITEAIQANPNFMQSEKDWLLRHPEVLTDPRKNAAIQNAFYQATQDQGLERGSNEYFKYMDKAMGYTKSEVKPRQPVVAAPVSREPTQESISGSRVTLTAAQREAAKLSGISDVDYARNLIKMRKAQRNGQLQP